MRCPQTLEASCRGAALPGPQSQVRPGRPTDLLEAPNPRFRGDAAASAAVLRALLSRQQQLLHPGSPLSPPGSKHRGFGDDGFLDGIKLSLPAAVSHANYLVCRVDGGETPTVSFFKNSGFFFLKKRYFLRCRFLWPCCVSR